jgi:hypothetical protein
MLQYLAGMGLAVPEPLGIVVDRDTNPNAMYLLTQDRPDLISLNSHDWSTLQPDQVVNRVQPAIDTLTTLHGKLVFHGDATFNNLATGDKAGSIIVFDTEYAVSHADTVRNAVDGGVPRELVLSLSHDLYSIQESFDEFIFPNLPEGVRPITLEQKTEYAITHFFEPYRTALKASDSPHKELLERALDIVIASRRAGEVLLPDVEALRLKH